MLQLTRYALTGIRMWLGGWGGTKELPAWGVQKPHRRVGKKWLTGKFLAAPAVMVKKPAGLAMRTTWKQLDCQGGRQPVWPWPGSLPQCQRLPGVASTVVHALRQLMAHGPGGLRCGVPGRGWRTSRHRWGGEGEPNRPLDRDKAGEWTQWWPSLSKLSFECLWPPPVKSSLLSDCPKNHLIWVNSVQTAPMACAVFPLESYIILCIYCIFSSCFLSMILVLICSDILSQLFPLLINSDNCWLLTLFSDYFSITVQLLFIILTLNMYFSFFDLLSTNI